MAEEEDEGEDEYCLIPADQEAVDAHCRAQLQRYYECVEAERLLRMLHHRFDSKSILASCPLAARIESKKTYVLEQLLLSGYVVSPAVQQEVKEVALLHLLSGRRDDFLVQELGPVSWDFLQKFSPVAGALFAEVQKSEKAVVVRTAIEAGSKAYREAERVYVPQLTRLQEEVLELQHRLARIDPLVQLASIPGKEVS